MGGVMGRKDPPRDGEGDRAKRGGGGSSPLRRPTVYSARKLRRTMSLPEALLWRRLRGSPGGVSFRKQHPIDPYVADFYCSAAKLVIELDGIAHDLGDRPERDEARDAFRDHGYRLFRIAAAEVLRDPDAVAESLIAYAVANPLHHRAARGGPPPRPGEDLR